VSQLCLHMLSSLCDVTARERETMPEIIDEMPATDGRSVYNWEDMADGQVRKLVKGRDFSCRPYSVRSAARAWAHRRGIKSHIRVLGDEVYVQLGESAA